MKNLDTLLKKSMLKHTPKLQVPANLIKAIEYSLLSPGKRIRPRLLLACGQMLGLSQKQIIEPALALEMIHCCTLIHDDLPCMDNDDFRRGKPSNHKVFGEALALLAGDALLCIAVDTFCDAAPFNKNFAAGFEVYRNAIGPRGIMGGQSCEMLLNENSKLKDLQRMHRMKTGALFEAAIQIPAAFSGLKGKSKKNKALLNFSINLGLGFQAMDDLEDYLQDQKNGKKELPYTSILKYQSPAQIAQNSLKKLDSGIKDIQSIWKKEAHNLVAITHEVSQKIREYESLLQQTASSQL